MKTLNKLSRKNISSWKKLTLAIMSLTSVLSYAQTNSSANGNWSTGSNWTSGVPQSGAAVNIQNNIILDTDFEIDGNGSYSILRGSITDPTGGARYKIKIKDSGRLEVSGNLSIEGELKVEDGGTLVVKGCDTLRIGGKLELKDNANITVEDCAVIFVGGDLKFKDDVIGVIDGNIKVGGKVETTKDAFINGTGFIEAEDKMDVKGNSLLFGSNGGCKKGPCTAGFGNSLPIVLGNFEANYITSKVIEVSWKTHSEINNNYFTLYHSTNGVDFTQSATILGAGNSNKKLEYKVAVIDLNAETIYFKLRQTDFNGEFEEFDPIVVRKKSNSNISLEEVLLFPNPGDGTNLTMVMKGLKPGISNVSIFSTSGELVLSKELRIDNGINSLKIDLLKGRMLKKGIYVVRVISEDVKIEKKYIVY